MPHRLVIWQLRTCTFTCCCCMRFQMHYLISKYLVAKQKYHAKFQRCRWSIGTTLSLVQPYRFDHRSAKNEINMYECCNLQVIIINELQKGSPGCKYIPYPAVSAHIGITFPVRSKAWALATATLALCTMTTSKTIIAHFRTPGMQKGRNIHTEIQFSNKTAG